MSSSLASTIRENTETQQGVLASLSAQEHVPWRTLKAHDVADADGAAADRTAATLAALMSSRRVPRSACPCPPQSEADFVKRTAPRLKHH